LNFLHFIPEGNQELARILINSKQLLQHLRQKHETHIAQCKRDMEVVHAQHQRALVDMERTMLEQRIQLQRKNDMQIKTMQMEAQNQAFAALVQHTTVVAEQNEKLTEQLKAAVSKAAATAAHRTQLERRVQELQQQCQVRERTVVARYSKLDRKEHQTENALDGQTAPQVAPVSDANLITVPPKQEIDESRPWLQTPKQRVNSKLRGISTSSNSTFQIEKLPALRDASSFEGPVMTDEDRNLLEDVIPRRLVPLLPRTMTYMKPPALSK
jgi:hypothetical protein